MSHSIKWEIVAVALFFSNISLATAGQSTSHTQSPAIGINTGEVKYETTYIAITPPVSKTLNSFERKQEALLLAQNPTTIELKNVRFIHFFSDAELFFGVDLRNTSKLAALDVRVDVMNLRSANRYKDLKPLVLTQSNMRREQSGIPLSYSPDSEGSVLLSSITDIRKVIGIPDSFCIYGASLRPNDLNELRELNPKDNFIGSSSTKSVPLLLRIRYKSIFEQMYTSFNWVFVNIADRRSDFVIINNTKTKLVCLE